MFKVQVVVPNDRSVLKWIPGLVLDMVLVSLSNWKLYNLIVFGDLKKISKIIFMESLFKRDYLDIGSKLKFLTKEFGKFEVRSKDLEWKQLCIARNPVPQWTQTQKIRKFCFISSLIKVGRNPFMSYVLHLCCWIQLQIHVPYFTIGQKQQNRWKADGKGWVPNVFGFESNVGNFILNFWIFNTWADLQGQCNVDDGRSTRGPHFPLDFTIGVLECKVPASKAQSSNKLETSKTEKYTTL